MKADVNYRFRVRAFNRNDDGLPASQRLELASTLVRLRSYDPFAGSIAEGRATRLFNEEELPGVEVYADSRSMFWGDEMVLRIRRALPDETPYDAGLPEEFRIASEALAVIPEINSRRGRFDTEAKTYNFPDTDPDLHAARIE